MFLKAEKTSTSKNVHSREVSRNASEYPLYKCWCAVKRLDGTLEVLLNV